MTTVRVATFNIRHGVGSDGQLDLARTAGAIAALEADVLGLQEVDDAFGPRSADEHQAARLGELLGMEVCFVPAIDLPPAPGRTARRRYGLALLSRHRILSHASHLLPGDPSLPAPEEPRALLHARLELPGEEPLDVLVTHLDPTRPGHRRAEVEQILWCAEDLWRDETLGGDAVLLGDVNADPAAPELAALTTAGWREASACLRRGGGRSPSSTSRGGARLVHLASQLGAALPVGAPRLRATYPASLPLRRIDAIWVRGDLTVSALETAAVRVSDHRPVLATLERNGSSHAPGAGLAWGP